MVSTSGVKAGRAARPIRLFAVLRQGVRMGLEPAGLSLCLFFLTFVEWFDIPSPFGAALMLAVTGKPSPLLLLPLGASMGVRALWGLNMDWWQYAGCAFL